MIYICCARGIVLKRSITPTILGLFQETMAYKQAFHAYSTILDSFFYPCKVIVYSFVIVPFFLKNITFCSIIVD